MPKELSETHQKVTTTPFSKALSGERLAAKYLRSFTAEITSIAFPAAKAIIPKSLGTRCLVLNSVHKEREERECVRAQKDIDWQGYLHCACSLQQSIVLHVGKNEVERYHGCN